MHIVQVFNLFDSLQMAYTLAAIIPQSSLCIGTMPRSAIKRG